MTTPLVIRCAGRALNPNRTQSEGDPCGAIFPRPVRGPILGGPGTPVNDSDYYTAARVTGWRLHHQPDGTLDAMCPGCAKPDPTLARLCRELGR